MSLLLLFLQCLTQSGTTGEACIFTAMWYFIIYNYRCIRSEFSALTLSGCLLLLDIIILTIEGRVKTRIIYLFSIRFHGVMVNIPDFLFGAPSSSLGEIYF